jgi:hypothetical protein
MSSNVFQVKAETARQLKLLAPGVVKVSPEGHIRMGLTGANAVLRAMQTYREHGTTVAYFPKQDLFVVVRLD